MVVVIVLSLSGDFARKLPFWGKCLFLSWLSVFVVVVVAVVAAVVVAGVVVAAD